MKEYIIEVKGDIIAAERIHYAQNWACRDSNSNKDFISNKYLYDEKTHTVNSNLILNENRRAVPYAIYFTKNDIYSNGIGTVAAYQGYGAALEYYKENISIISNLLKIDIDKDIEQYTFHGLFTDVFSILELFLSDLILTLIYTNDTIYEKAIDYYKTSNKCRNEVKEIERKVHNLFFNGIVYHKFDKVRDIFIKLIGLEFPNTERLRIYLHKRNNIVHRFSFSNIDRMGIIKITKNDIINLINESNFFVEKLIDNLKLKLGD